MPARPRRAVMTKEVKRMSCQPKYRVAAGLIVLLLLLPGAVGSVSPGLAAAKAIQPINDFMTTPEATNAVQPNDFITLTTAGLELNGKLWAMPMLAAPYMLGYRTDLFSDATEKQAFQAKYGYALAVPQTYKQLMDIAQFFTRKKGEMLAGRPLNDDFYGIVMANKRGG